MIKKGCQITHKKVIYINHKTGIDAITSYSNDGQELIYNVPIYLFFFSINKKVIAFIQLATSLYPIAELVG